MVSFRIVQNDKLTNTALLLSDQNSIVGSFVACTRWDGLDKISAKDDIEFYGSVLSQIENTMNFVKKHMSNGWIKEGKVTRREIPEYDLDALREAIINAEAHRSYLRRGTNIELGFYDDRIEIVSVGGISRDKSIEDLLKEPISERRNPLLCDIFSRLDFMERRGSGIEKIKQAYANDKKKPKFSVIGEVFKVVFYSRLYNEKSSNNHPKIIRKSSENTPKDTILEYIRTNKTVTKKQLMADVGLTEGQIKYTLLELKKNNKIQANGKGKSTSYTIKRNK